MPRAVSGGKTTGQRCVETRRAPSRRIARWAAMRPISSGAAKQLCGTRAGVPVVALHPVRVLRDGRAGEATIGALIGPLKAARVHNRALGVAGIEASALGVLDARVKAERSRFAAAGGVDTLGGRDRVDIIEEEVLRAGIMRAERFPLRQSGKGVHAGNARE